MALLLFRRRKLHRKIKEALNVAFRVALDESYELLCRRHTLSMYRGFPSNTPPRLRFCIALEAFYASEKS